MSDDLKLPLENFTKPEVPLGSKLNALRRFGEPVLSWLNVGWWARIDMHVSGAGQKFRIESETKHATPDAAVNELAGRIAATLIQLKSLS